MANVTVRNRASDFLGAAADYKEMDDTGVFFRRADDAISLLVPDDEGTMEITIQR